MPRRRKRRRGEGSIYRRADGYYVAAYVVGRDPNGRPKRKVIYGKSREAVEDALFTARNLVPDNPRITEYCDYWLRTVAEPKLRPTTYYEYHRVIEKHIKPFIGAYHLRDIDESKVERYLEALKGSTKSAVIQRLVLILLKRIFNHAVQNRIIQANPTRNISRPRYTTAIRRALTVQEVRRLLDVVKDDRYEAVYVLAVTAGMRIGEILALRWEDVDFDAGTIAIRRTIVEKGGKFMLGPPKTTKSFRTIYIPQIAILGPRGLCLPISVRSPRPPYQVHEFRMVPRPESRRPGRRRVPSTPAYRRDPPAPRRHPSGCRPRTSRCPSRSMSIRMRPPTCIDNQPTASTRCLNGRDMLQIMLQIDRKRSNFGHF